MREGFVQAMNKVCLWDVNGIFMGGLWDIKIKNCNYMILCGSSFL